MAGGVVVSSGGGKDYPGKLTMFVLFACIVAATGGLIFGYDIGISGTAPSTVPAPLSDRDVFVFFCFFFYPWLLWWKENRKMAVLVCTASLAKTHAALFSRFANQAGYFLGRGSPTVRSGDWARMVQERLFAHAYKTAIFPLVFFIFLLPDSCKPRKKNLSMHHLAIFQNFDTISGCLR